MRLTAGIRIALRSLAANPLRAVLTALGVIIGVAAVLTAVGITTGARESVAQQISALGTNLLTVIPGRAAGPGGIFQGGGTIQTLTWEDGEAIGEEAAEIEAVAAEFARSAQVVAGAQNDQITVSGVTAAYPDVRNWRPVAGSFLTEEDVRRRTRVAVIGTTTRDTLFPDQDPLGRQIRINRVAFTVIGVMESKGATAFTDRDDIVFVPLTTAQRRLFGVTHVRTIYLKVRRAELMTEAARRVEELLRARHRVPDGEEADFIIRNQAEVLQAFEGVNRTITNLLGGIAAVSLLVGGIGIMNIMLVSVMERTREIGIRKAVGATRRDVLLQFLVEAVTLSVAGGLVGVGAGLGVARLFATQAGWAVSVTPAAILLAFGFAVAVGIFFGLYPAQRAAALDPIVALRYE